MHWPMHQASRCHAKSKQSGLQCRAPAVRGHSVCRMHGAGGGAPKGNRNALKHGASTAETIALRKEIVALARMARETLPRSGRAMRNGSRSLAEWPDLVRPLAFAQTEAAEAAEAEEARREHRPSRWFGDGRRARWSESGRAMRHEEVQRRGIDDLLQTHASAAGPRIQGPLHAGCAVERKGVKAGPHEAPESEDVEAVASRQREAAGQVDGEAAVERRDLGDRQRPVLSPKSPSKSKPSTPAGACVKLPVMVCGVAIRSAAMLVTVPAPPLTEISSPSAVLPPAKVRFPLPIVIVPPVQDPKVSPDPPDCRSRPR